MSATALIVSVISAVFAWKRTAIRLEEHRDRQRASLRAECLPIGVGACRVVIYNRGRGKASRIKFRMDGFSLGEHPLLTHNSEEVTELEGGDNFRYNISFSMGEFISPLRGVVSNSGPWQVELEWVDGSGQSGRYVKRLDCLKS